MVQVADGQDGRYVQQGCLAQKDAQNGSVSRMVDVDDSRFIFPGFDIFYTLFGLPWLAIFMQSYTLWQSNMAMEHLYEWKF